MKKYGIIKDDRFGFRTHLGRLRTAYVSRKTWIKEGYPARTWIFILKRYVSYINETAFVQITVLGLQVAYFYKGKLT